MKTYDLYGTSDLTMSDLCTRVAETLEVSFQERDSGYRGGIYFRAGDLRNEHFVILANDQADDPEELPEPDFADHRVLLEVNGTLRADSLRERLGAIPELALLRTRVIERS